MRRLSPFFAAALLGVVSAGCGASDAASPATQAQMEDGFTHRPDPSTLPADQQAKATEMKAMAGRMAAGGSRAGGGK